MKNNDIEHDVKSFIDLMDHDELMKLYEYIIKRIRYLCHFKFYHFSFVHIIMNPYIYWCDFFFGDQQLQSYSE